MTTTANKKRLTLGRAAFIEFPELGVADIPAKTDTGAYRSAIHAANIEVKTIDGQQVLAFDLLAGHPSAGQSVHCETSEFKVVGIENSFGHREERYEVRLLCVLEGKRFRTSFTLANRSKKIYPVLLGRRLINRRFIVDTLISHIDRRVLREKFNIELPQDEEDA